MIVVIKGRRRVFTAILPLIARLRHKSVRWKHSNTKHTMYTTGRTERRVNQIVLLLDPKNTCQSTFFKLKIAASQHDLTTPDNFSHLLASLALLYVMLYVIYHSPTSGGNNLISVMLGCIESLRFLSIAATYCVCIPPSYEGKILYWGHVYWCDDWVDYCPPGIGLQCGEMKKKERLKMGQILQDENGDNGLVTLRI